MYRSCKCDTINFISFLIVLKPIHESLSNKTKTVIHIYNKYKHTIHMSTF